MAIVIGLGAGALWAARSGDAERTLTQPESDGIDDYDTDGHSDDCSDHRGAYHGRTDSDSNPNTDADTDEDRPGPHRQPDDHVATAWRKRSNPRTASSAVEGEGDFESNGAP